MEWMLLSGCVVGAWSVLSIIGRERQCRIEQARREVRLAWEQASRKADEIVELKEVKSR